MERVRLSTIVKQIRGVSYKPEDLNPTAAEGYVPLLRAGNFNENRIADQEDLVYVSKKNVTKEQYLQGGDILLATSSGSIEVVGKSLFIEQSEGFTFGAFCKVVRPDNRIVLPKYISYFFQTDHYRRRIRALAQGANIKNLRNEHIDNLEVPLPDLETQSKIIAILDKANLVLDKRQRAILYNDELIRASFLEMFGNPMERPNRWGTQRIKDFLKDITAGASYGGEDKRQLKDDEVGVLKVSAVTKGIFDPTEYKAVERAIIKKSVIHPQKGDLLFSRANTLELVGATCIVHENYDQLILPDKLWKVETDNEKVSKVYLHYVLKNKDVRKTFLSIATGSSGSMLNISMDKFKNIEVPVPPIELQQRFEHLYYKYIDLRTKLLASRDYIKSLLSSLSDLAFKGDLKFGSIIDLEVLLERDYIFFKQQSTKETIQQLLNRLDKSELNENKFYDPATYDKAKSFVFELLKEGRIKQVYDSKRKTVKLAIP